MSDEIVETKRKISKRAAELICEIDWHCVEEAMCSISLRSRYGMLPSIKWTEGNCAENETAKAEFETAKTQVSSLCSEMADFMRGRTFRPKG